MKGKSLIKIIKDNWLAVLSTIFCFIVAILWCLSKRTFQVDESLTFALANYEGGWVTYDTLGEFPSNMWSAYSVSKKFDYLNVYINQKYDVHPPLYYAILHTIMSFSPGKISLWFAFSINLIAYLLDMILIYLIIIKFTDNKTIGSLGILMFGLNKNVLDAVIFIRMYMLSSLFCLLFLYYGLKILLEKDITIKNYILLTISIICGGLTHYHFYVVAGSICLFMGIYLIINKRYKELKNSIISVIAGGFTNLIIFEPVLGHLYYSDHSKYAVSSLTEVFLSKDRLSTFINGSWGGYLQSAISIILVVILVYNITKDKTNKNLIISLIIVCSYLLSFYVISLTGKLIATRYLIPTYSLGILGNMLSIYFLVKDKVNLNTLSLIFIVMIALNINYSFIIDNINTQTSWDYAKSNNDMVAYILTDEDGMYDYQINTLFLDLANYKKVTITRLNEDMPINKNEKYVLYVENDINEDKAIKYLNKQIGEGNININKLDIQTSLFNMYEVSFN